MLGKALDVLGGGGGGEPAAVAAHRLVHAYVRERQQPVRQPGAMALPLAGASMRGARSGRGGGAEAGAVAGASRAGAAGIS